MKNKLATRRSVQRLMSLEGCGGLDARSEIGTVIDIEEWSQKPEVRYHCHCEQVKDNEELISSHMIITDKHMYLLRPTEKKNRFVVRTRRTLSSIMKITSKAKMVDVVKFQYGSKGCDGIVHVTDFDRFHIPNSSGTVIQAIKGATVSPHVSKVRRPSMMAEMHQGGHSPSPNRPSAITEERRPSTVSQDLLCASPYVRRSLDLSSEKRASSEPKSREYALLLSADQPSTSGRRGSTSSTGRQSSNASEGRQLSKSSHGRRSPKISDGSINHDWRRPSASSINSLSAKEIEERRSSYQSTNELSIPLQDLNGRRPSLPAVITNKTGSELQGNGSLDDIHTKKRASKPSAFIQFFKKKLGN